MIAGARCDVVADGIQLTAHHLGHFMRDHAIKIALAGCDAIAAVIVEGSGSAERHAAVGSGAVARDQAQRLGFGGGHRPAVRAAYRVGGRQEGNRGDVVSRGGVVGECRLDLRVAIGVETIAAFTQKRADIAERHADVDRDRIGELTFEKLSDGIDDRTRRGADGRVETKVDKHCRCPSMTGDIDRRSLVRPPRAAAIKWLRAFPGVRVQVPKEMAVLRPKSSLIMDLQPKRESNENLSKAASFSLSSLSGWPDHAGERTTAPWGGQRRGCAVPTIIVPDAN